jgi:hypothetical protein
MMLAGAQIFLAQWTTLNRKRQTHENLLFSHR